MDKRQLCSFAGPDSVPQSASGYADAQEIMIALIFIILGAVLRFEFEFTTSLPAEESR
jgi:hypothetical protein